MEVLFAEESDAEDILKLQYAAYHSEAELHDDFNIPPLTQSLEELKADFKTKVILKIVENGKLLASGQARLESGCCHIGRMAVWPQYQGQGIGSKLLVALEKVFSNASRIELFTGENSEANLAMYRHRGYKQFKTAKLGKTTVIFLERHV